MTPRQWPITGINHRVSDPDRAVVIAPKVTRVAQSGVPSRTRSHSGATDHRRFCATSEGGTSCSCDRLAASR